MLSQALKIMQLDIGGIPWLNARTITAIPIGAVLSGKPIMPAFSIAL
jgi:hypothetical protein